MIAEKKESLQSIIESSEGIHLTAYLVNRGNLLDLKSQLQETIQEAHEYLQGVQSHEQQKRFLEPISNLLKDSRILKNIKGNIAIFRNENAFRVVNIPIDVEQSFHVATSFHIKPLLRWIQCDEDFLLLGVEKDGACLYVGSQHSLKLVDSCTFTRSVQKKDILRSKSDIKPSGKDEDKKTRFLSWLNDRLAILNSGSKPKLFLAGEDTLIEPVIKDLNYNKLIKHPVAHFFSKERISDICKNIRMKLKAESRKNLEKSLMEFHFAEKDNRARKNIFQISKAVVQGKVRKLIVTDELNIFGKIDQKSGGLSIHPIDLDHEDDCILDDLAQMVLNQGGEVVIAKRNEIPKGRPILAILDEEGDGRIKANDLHLLLMKGEHHDSNQI